MTITREEILEKLLGETPVSITRCGDGEAIVLNATAGYNEFELASVAVLKRQMGYSPSVEDVKAIRENLIECYNNCDCIGVPMHKQETSSHWKKVFDILNKNTQNDGVYCDIDIAYQMLKDDSYERLLMNRKRLYYVSCRDLDEGFKRKYGVSYAVRYAIAPEAKFTSGYEGEAHYPTQFNKIQRWMDKVNPDNRPHLLLVGAGVIGKIYCNWWRDRGGIAMDVGGVMDIFAGYVTRGPERGLDKLDPNPIYKL